MLLVPAMILFLLQAPQIRETDLSSLRLIVYGAAPIPAELLRQAMAIFRLRLPAGLRPDRDDRRHHPAAARGPRPGGRRRSCCPAAMRQDGVELRIVDDDGKDVPPGEVGEIVDAARRRSWRLLEPARGDGKRAIRGGWFFTGDAGYLDEDGYLYIHDRVKDMIVSGGENIYPAEVESALFGHPAVADVAVIGVPDERWGEAVKAVVVRSPAPRSRRAS